MINMPLQSYWEVLIFTFHCYRYVTGLIVLHDLRCHIDLTSNHQFTLKEFVKINYRVIDQIGMKNLCVNGKFKIAIMIF